MDLCDVVREALPFETNASGFFTQDCKLLSLLKFWDDLEHLSMHAMMHPPTWPALHGQQFCIASVLDLIIRERQLQQPVPCPVPTIPDSAESMQDEPADPPTPWLEVPDCLGSTLRLPSSTECVVVFRH